MHHARRGLLLLQVGVLFCTVLVALFDNTVVERPDLRTATYNIGSCGGLARCNAQGAIDIMNIIVIASMALAGFIFIHTYSDHEPGGDRLVSEEHSAHVLRALWMLLGAFFGYIFTLWYAVSRIQSHSQHNYNIVDMGPVIAPVSVAMCLLLPQIVVMLPEHSKGVIEKYFGDNADSTTPRRRRAPAGAPRERNVMSFSNPAFGMDTGGL